MVKESRGSKKKKMERAYTISMQIEQAEQH